MEKILTVSVAAYNVEKTIRQTLDSFCQSKYLKEIEILVVNDGSKDNTANIVKEYEIKYPESIRLISKENGGHGSTINTSIAQGTGKYFKVVDGDDWVDAEALDRLIERLRETNADMVINDYVEVYPTHQVEKYIGEGKEQYRTYTMEELPINQEFPMHSITILLSLMQRCKYKISEKRFYADTEYIFFAMLMSQKIEFQNKIVYCYRLGEAGQSVSKEGIYNHIEDYLFIVERLISVYKEVSLNLDSKNNERIKFFIIDRYRLIFDFFKVMPKHDKDYLLKKFDYHMQKKYPELIGAMPLGRKKIIRWNYTIGLWILRFWNKLK